MTGQRRPLRSMMKYEHHLCGDIMAEEIFDDDYQIELPAVNPTSAVGTTFKTIQNFLGFENVARWANFDSVICRLLYYE